MKLDRVSSRLCVLGVLTALAGVLVAGQQFGEQPAKLRVLKAAADVFVLNNDVAPGNATALVTEAGVILIDDKFAVDHDSIVGTLKTLTDQPIRYVVNTHHHRDHAGGNARLLQLHIPVIASHQAWRNMSGQPTNGDVMVHLPAHRMLVTGDLFTFGPATPELIDYAGGGSAKEWTATLDQALKLDFATVIPGHGVLATRADLRAFRDGTVRLSTRVQQMVVQKKSRDEIAQMLRTEFGWFPFLLDRGLDGLIGEHQ